MKMLEQKVKTYSLNSGDSYNEATSDINKHIKNGYLVKQMLCSPDTRSTYPQLFVLFEKFEDNEPT